MYTEVQLEFGLNLKIKTTNEIKLGFMILYDPGNLIPLVETKIHWRSGEGI